MNKTFDGVVQEVATEWLNKVLDALESNNSELLGELVVPNLMSLSLIKVEWENEGKVWDVLRACEHLGDEIIHSLNSMEEEPNKSVKKAAKKVAKKAAKKGTKTIKGKDKEG